MPLPENLERLLLLEHQDRGFLVMTEDEIGPSWHKIYDCHIFGARPNYNDVHYSKFFIDFILIVLYRVISVRILKAISWAKDKKLKYNELPHTIHSAYSLKRYLIKDANSLLSILLLCFKSKAINIFFEKWKLRNLGLFTGIYLLLRTKISFSHFVLSFSCKRSLKIW